MSKIKKDCGCIEDVTFTGGLPGVPVAYCSQHEPADDDYE